MRRANGWVNGILGVLIFSGSLPATRIAVMDFDPMFLTAVRATIATALAVCLLSVFRQQRPEKGDLISLAIIAGGVVVGFPLLSALSLQHVSSAAHSIVFIGLLPLITAIFGVLRARERPKPAFWLFSILGSALVVVFAVTQGFEASLEGNAYMMGAIIVCGLGYSEGAILSRKLGGWQVISWALVVSLPVMLVISLTTMPETLEGIHTEAWAALAYVSLFSMLIGFVFWYRGLAQGGIAAVGQLQLLQPFFGLILAASILHESISLSMILTSIGVVGCVAGAKYFAK